MKNLIIIASSLLILSCSKPNNNGPIVNNPSTWDIVYYPVPNWATDTMIGRSIYNTYFSDTIYSFVANGKTYIKYKSVQYEVRAWNYKIDPKGKNEMQYFANIYDMSGRAINDTNSIDCAVSPIKYYDSTYSKWRDQPQQIMCPFPPFPDSVYAGLYSTF